MKGAPPAVYLCDAHDEDDEEEVPRLNPGADGYGVGTAVADAPLIDFILDLVEIR